MKRKTLILLCIIAPFVASCSGEKKEGNVNEQTERYRKYQAGNEKAFPNDDYEEQIKD